MAVGGLLAGGFVSFVMTVGLSDYWPLIVLVSALAGAALFALLAQVGYQTYESRCSECGEDLETLVSSAKKHDISLAYCPCCGEKLEEQ